MNVSEEVFQYLCIDHSSGQFTELMNSSVDPSYRVLMQWQPGSWVNWYSINPIHHHRPCLQVPHRHSQSSLPDLRSTSRQDSVHISCKFCWNNACGSKETTVWTLKFTFSSEHTVASRIFSNNESNFAQLFRQHFQCFSNECQLSSR